MKNQLIILLLLVGIHSPLFADSSTTYKIEHQLLIGQIDSAKYYLLNSSLNETTKKHAKILNILCNKPSEASYTDHYNFVDGILGQHPIELIEKYVNRDVLFLNADEEYNHDCFEFHWLIMNVFREFGDVEVANKEYARLNEYYLKLKDVTSQKGRVTMEIKLSTHQAFLAQMKGDADLGLKICAKMEKDAREIKDTNSIIGAMYHKCDFLIIKQDIDGYIETCEQAYELNAILKGGSQYEPAVKVNLVNSYIYKNVNLDKSITGRNRVR